MRFHAENRARPTQVRLTGGASASILLRHIVADVFQAPVVVGESAEAAALGAAMRAANACGGFDFETLTGRFCTATETVDPNRQNAEVYEQALENFRKLYLNLES